MSDDDDVATLGELLCARLCHDLAGAVGAVGTGVELLTDELGSREFADDAVALLATSAEAAVHRLKFLRIALGHGGQSLSCDQLKGLVADFLGPSGDAHDGVRLIWNDAEPAIWDGGAVKLLLNLILLARDCLSRGGDLIVESAGSGAEIARVTAKGPKAGPAESALALTAHGAGSLGPRGAQGYYTALLAQRIGASVSCEDSHECVVFVAVKN
ncbi:histidine phosphotransferase family protein [Telmatospirillum sp.]|uniref:histidine phosphotransferase family protein n=1 Tax=Telmatospirillum sp. TaxID=2079197 RepID=UPI00283DA76F|nr:histidine phosphotransferase family protein [Telmatospirillum sp.]MDR3440762.1 histidine phosphotransferase family protein [Telmatospirillum sp.]